MVEFLGQMQAQGAHAVMPEFSAHFDCPRYFPNDVWCWACCHSVTGGLRDPCPVELTSDFDVSGTGDRAEPSRMEDWLCFATIKRRILLRCSSHLSLLPRPVSMTPQSSITLRPSSFFIIPRPSFVIRIHIASSVLHPPSFILDDRFHLPPLSLEALVVPA